MHFEIWGIDRFIILIRDLERFRLWEIGHYIEVKFQM